MYAIDITLKNGKKIEALIWSMDLENDLITLLNERDGEKYPYRVSDIIGGTFYSDRIRETSQRYNFLDKMVELGWSS